MGNGFTLHPVRTIRDHSGARTANVSENTLRRKADRGEIEVIRTASGMRLYRREDLLKLRERNTR